METGTRALEMLSVASWLDGGREIGPKSTQHPHAEKNQKLSQAAF